MGDMASDDQSAPRKAAAVFCYNLLEPSKVVAILWIQPSPVTEYPISGSTEQINSEFRKRTVSNNSRKLTLLCS